MDKNYFTLFWWMKTTRYLYKKYSQMLNVFNVTVICIFKQENMNNSNYSQYSNSNLNVNASLKDVYKQLTPPLISQRVYDDLSICIVFQLILFLANEHVN